MGKKYIVELGRCERLYKAFIDGNGKPELTWLSPEIDLTPYTEPDLEQVRKEAFEEGYKKCMSENDFDSPCVSCDKYEQGLNDAWEAAKKIVLDTIPPDALIKMFGNDPYSLIGKIFEVYSASEVTARIKAWEEEQKEIKVGDEVERILDGEVDSKAVFLEEDEGYYHCLFWTGCCFITLGYPKKQFRKTGRHLSEIDAVIEKMRGEKE